MRDFPLQSRFWCFPGYSAKPTWSDSSLIIKQRNRENTSTVTDRFVCYVSFYALEHLSFICSCCMMGCFLTSWCESNDKSRCSRAPHRPFFFFLFKVHASVCAHESEQTFRKKIWDDVLACFHDSAPFEWPVWSFMSGAQGQIFPGLDIKCKICQTFWCKKRIRLNRNLTSVSMHPFLWQEAVMEIIWQRLVFVFFYIYFAHKSLN